MGPRLHADRRLLQPRQHRAEHALRPRARRRRRRDVHPRLRRTTRTRRRASRVEVDIERRHRRARRPRGRVTGRVVLRAVDHRRLHGLSRVDDDGVVGRPAQQRAVATDLCDGSCRRSSSTASSVSRRRCSTSAIASASRRGCPSPTTSCASRVLVWFHLVDPTPMLATLGGSRDLMWLGLGTTLGVAVQFLCLIPSLFRSRPLATLVPLQLEGPRAARGESPRQLDAAGRRAQSALALRRLAFAFGIGGDGPVSAYTYGWSFMQMPYAVVVVSVLGVLTPQLAGMSTAPRLRGTERTSALRTSPVARHHHPVHPRALVLAQPIVAILLKHLNASHDIWDVEPCSRSWPPDCRASRSSNSACADCSRCSARARSSISTRCRTPSPSCCASRSVVTRSRG